MRCNMSKKLIIAVLTAVLLLSFVGCGKTKTLHCDSCGTEVKVDANSNMEEDWSIYCKDCEKENGLDTVVNEE